MVICEITAGTVSPSSYFPNKRRRNNIVTGKQVLSFNFSLFELIDKACKRRNASLQPGAIQV